MIRDPDIDEPKAALSRSVEPRGRSARAFRSAIMINTALASYSAGLCGSRGPPKNIFDTREGRGGGPIDPSDERLSTGLLQPSLESPRKRIFLGR